MEPFWNVIDVKFRIYSESGPGRVLASFAGVVTFWFSVECEDSVEFCVGVVESVVFVVGMCVGSVTLVLLSVVAFPVTEGSVEMIALLVVDVSCAWEELVIADAVLG